MRVNLKKTVQLRFLSDRVYRLMHVHTVGGQTIACDFTPSQSKTLW